MKKENNMMWTRFELKERGKAAFQRNYWRSVLVAFILMLFVSGGGSAVSNSWNQITSSGTSDDSYYTEYFDEGDIGHFYYNSGTSIPGMLVSGIIAVVVGGVMIVSALLGICLSEGHVRKNRIDFIFTETFYWSVVSASDCTWYRKSLRIPYGSLPSGR